MGGIFTTVAKFATKNLGAILIGMGITGAAGALVSMYDETKKEKKTAPKHNETKKEKFVRHTKDFAKNHWRTALIFATSVILICTGASKLAADKKALISALGATESAFASYKNEVKEIIGEDEEAEISRHSEAVRKKELEKSEDAIGPTISATFNTDQVIQFAYDGIIFPATRDMLCDAVVRNNIKLITQEEISVYDILSDVYYEFPLNRKFSNIGYSISDVDFTKGFKVDTSECILVGGKPCVNIKFDPPLSSL